MAPAPAPLPAEDEDAPPAPGPAIDPMASAPIPGGLQPSYDIIYYFDINVYICMCIVLDETDDEINGLGLGAAWGRLLFQQMMHQIG